MQGFLPTRATHASILPINRQSVDTSNIGYTALEPHPRRLPKVDTAAVVECFVMHDSDGMFTIYHLK